MKKIFIMILVLFCFILSDIFFFQKYYFYKAARKVVFLSMADQYTIRVKAIPGTQVTDINENILTYANADGIITIKPKYAQIINFTHQKYGRITKSLVFKPCYNDIGLTCEVGDFNIEKDQKQVLQTTSDRTAVRNNYKIDGLEIDMVFIPEGEMCDGGNNVEKGDNMPPIRIEKIDAFYISKYEISNKQFQEFVEKTGYRTDAENNCGGVTTDGRGHWELNDQVTWQKPFIGNITSEPPFDEQPVVMVSWRDAMAFCNWLSKKTDHTITLPTEKQWVRAYHGQNNWIYPWGAAWHYTKDPDRFNYGKYKIGTPGVANDEDGYLLLAPVKAYPNGQSFFGVYNMLGNAKEWLNDDFEDNRPEKIFSRVFTGKRKIVRGGGWYSHREQSLLDRHGHDWSLSFVGVGFRIVELIGSP